MSGLAAFRGQVTAGDRLDLHKYFANVDQCLRNYRALKLYVDQVFTEFSIQFESGEEVPAHLHSVLKSKAVTMALLEHINSQMLVYEHLMALYGCERRYEIVKLKYFTLPDKKQKLPHTNEELAEHFDCDERTIRREIDRARDELKLLLFGATKL